MPEMRVGCGYDAHRLVASGELKLGGITAGEGLSLEGHSDGDVVIHAVVDALLGAAGMGDIGTHFPDSDPHFAGRDSSYFLERTALMLREASWRVVNLDLTLIIEKPVMAPYRAGIELKIAGVLDLEPSQVNIKFKTGNGIGDSGRGEAAECHASAFIERISD